VGGGSAAAEGGPQVGHVAARRAVAGDAALHERRVDPADAGDLARGVDVVDARALVDVDVDEAVRPDRAPGGYGELQARGEAVADAHRVGGEGPLGAGDRGPAGVEAGDDHFFDAAL